MSARAENIIEFRVGRERDLHAEQKQLGHASVTTTQIYADVLEEDIRAQVEGLWRG